MCDTEDLDIFEGIEMDKSCRVLGLRSLVFNSRGQEIRRVWLQPSSHFTKVGWLLCGVASCAELGNQLGRHSSCPGGGGGWLDKGGGSQQDLVTKGSYGVDHSCWDGEEREGRWEEGGLPHSGMGQAYWHRLTPCEMWQWDCSDVTVLDTDALPPPRHADPKTVGI